MDDIYLKLVEKWRKDADRIDAANPDMEDVFVMQAEQLRACAAQLESVIEAGRTNDCAK